MRFLFAGHTLDIDRRELLFGAKPVALEPRVFDLLIFLVANRDRVVSRDDVFDQVWSGRIVSDSALTTRIAAARRAIGDSGEGQKLIRTIPRKGFRFVGEVRVEAGAAGLHAETPQPGPAMTEALALPDKPSIAVLPFANMSRDPEQEFFSDGIADDIISELSREHSLFVISRTSSVTYKGRAVDAKRAGRELGVRYVLEGSTRRDEARIRVNVQLIEAETRNHIWGERYDRAIESIFAVQDEIATAVARAINPAIFHAERQRAMQKPRESLSAWEAWHRAVGFMAKRDISGRRDFLQKAVALTPRFASAHAMLAFHYISEATSGMGPSMRESGRLAEEAARTAIALDPRSSVAHAMLAWTLCSLGDRGLALEEANTAIALNSNDPWGYLSKGLHLMVSGHHAEARETLANALRLDPLGPTASLVSHLRAHCYYFERDYSAAEAAARRLIREYPEFSRPPVTLAAALGQLGRVEEARVALEAAIATSLPILRFMTNKGLSHWRPEDLEHLLDGLRKAGWNG
jgi:TolB-like protein/Tfp pilus assembly protein PilF